MTYANNGRQTLQATLAAGNLDFTPYISTFRLLASGARDWNRQLFDLNALSATDLDMRLSAAKVTVGPTKLGRTAFGANLRNGALALSDRRSADVWRHRQGLVRHRALRRGRRRQGAVPVHRRRSAGLRQRIVRHHTSCPAAAISTSRWRPPARARSASPPRSTARATLTGHDGAIAGFNVEQLLKRLERRPLSGGGNFRQGTTPYDNLTVVGEIHRRHRHRRGRPRRRPGRAPDADRHRLGAGARIRPQGRRQPDLGGRTPATGFELPFVVQGPWDDPLIFPDPESLIRRSPAPRRCSMRSRTARPATR